MRVSALIITLVCTALLASACGGPEDSQKQLVKACERQIAEIAELDKEQTGTAVAPSTTERLSKQELIECAGQPRNQTSVVDEGADDGSAMVPGEDDAKDATSADEPATVPVKLDPAARELFITSCGGCHMMSDAGTNGAVGPNLDETKMTAEEISSQIINGAGAMPAGLLQGDDVNAVSEYVAGAAAAAQADK